MHYSASCLHRHPFLPTKKQEQLNPMMTCCPHLGHRPNLRASQSHSWTIPHHSPCRLHRQLHLRSSVPCAPEVCRTHQFYLFIQSRCFQMLETLMWVMSKTKWKQWAERREKKQKTTQQWWSVLITNNTPFFVHPASIKILEMVWYVTLKKAHLLWPLCRQSSWDKYAIAWPLFVRETLFF